jgi:hypothetical protein
MIENEIMHDDINVKFNELSQCGVKSFVFVLALRIWNGLILLRIGNNGGIL